MRTPLIVAVLMAFGCCATASDAAALQPVQSIPLDGVEGRIDHMAIDGQGKRLYIAALGNNTVEVVDLVQGRQAGRIGGLKKPQGLCVLPESGDMIAASGDDGKCRMYSASSKPLATVDGLDDADNVRYDPATKLIYVGYGDGALAVIDVGTFTKVGDIKLDGHPESFQLEAEGRRIFVNVPTAAQVTVIDRVTRTVTARWPVNEAKANFPMALDEGNHRLFVGCRQPAKLLVLDTESGRTVACLDCCGDTDDVFHDAATKGVYVSGGEGCISIFDQVDANHYPLAAKVATAAGARTSLFVAQTGRYYLAVPHRGQQAAELRVLSRQPNR